MNQQIIGEALKQLRKNKGITQQQLADMLHTTNRSVSRWETGNNLPDISILIELAEYYEVDLKDILSGEVLKKDMNTLEKDTVLLVADYTNMAKERMKKVLHVLFIISAIGIIGTLIIEEINLNGSIWNFFKGLGIGLAIGSLVVGSIYTSKNSDKFFDRKMEISKNVGGNFNLVLLLLAALCFIYALISIIFHFERRYLFIDLAGAFSCLIGYLVRRNTISN